MFDTGGLQQLHHNVPARIILLYNDNEFYMRCLRRVRLTILHFADRTHVVADVPSSSKLLNATSLHTAAATTTIICYIGEGYELILSLYNLPQFAYLFPSLLPHFWLTWHSLLLHIFRVFPFMSLLFLCPYLTVSSFHLISLSLFFVFRRIPSLAPCIKFSFPLCFIASFCHLPSFVFISPRLLFLPRFVPSVLFMPFSYLFLFPMVFRLSQISRFRPYFYIVLLLPFSVSFSGLLVFFHYIIFLAIFFLDDSQDTQTYTLYTLRRDICTPVMQTFWRELTTAK